MRRRVTTKILLIASLALTCLAGAMIGLMFQRACADAARVQDECRNQLLTEFSEGRALASQDRDDLAVVQSILTVQREAGIPLPEGARLVTVTVPSASGSSSDTVFDEKSATDQSSASSDETTISSLTEYLSPLPEKTFFRIPLRRTCQARAQVDFRATRAAEGREIAGAIQSIATGFIVFLIGLCACLETWVARPAAAVVRLSRSIVHGDRSIRLAVQSPDEFGQIMQAYNDLVDDLFTTQHQADTDGLTGLYNHRYLHEKIGEAISQASASEHAMAVIVIDLDKFKLLNDIYGHLTGDRYLRQTGDVLRRAVHLDGIAGRYGGDEFLIVLPRADAKRAAQMEQRVRCLMAQEQFRPHPLADPLPLAFSLGVAVYPDHGSDAQELISYADAALYMEKSGGFNLLEFTRQIEAEYLKSHPHSPTQRQGHGEAGGFRMLFNLVVAVDKRDSYTKRHSEHVAHWAVRLAGEIGLSREEQQIIQIAGLLHDVGKIGVPDTILSKPGTLTDEEYDIMKGHVTLAVRLIHDIPHQAQVQEIVACHHERWDGRGYPAGRHGSEMPLAGRILSLVDAYSAMSLDRPYRSGMEIAEICRRLRKGSGEQFDPALVEPLVALLCAAAGQTSERAKMSAVLAADSSPRSVDLRPAA